MIRCDACGAEAVDRNVEAIGRMGRAMRHVPDELDQQQRAAVGNRQIARDAPTKPRAKTQCAQSVRAAQIYGPAGVNARQRGGQAAV